MNNRYLLLALLLALMIFFPELALAAAEEAAGEGVTEEPATYQDLLANIVGMNFFEEEIDQVIFDTNSFLKTGATAAQGPFWYIMQFSMCLGAVFALIMAAGMGYKMLVKGEPFDPLKLLRVLAISSVMYFWYNGVLDGLAYAPNAIGSWLHDLYNIERSTVQTSYNALQVPMEKVDSMKNKVLGQQQSAVAKMNQSTLTIQATDQVGTYTVKQADEKAHSLYISGIYGAVMILLDKIVLWMSIAFFRIGWWGTIYCQQIILGMLTIFGPIQWAFSLLPKWEGAWAKWLIRYLTVHFYGAMLYFVGFYVLLLFDIVINIQAESLSAIAQTEQTFSKYLSHALMTSGYLLVASVVSMKCLNLVPDLAAWMIPEGENAFSTRGFGEGVASQVKQSAMGAVRGILH